MKSTQNFKQKDLSDCDNAEKPLLQETVKDERSTSYSYNTLIEEVKKELPDTELYIVARAVAANLGYETEYVQNGTLMRVKLPGVRLDYPVC